MYAPSFYTRSPLYSEAGVLAEDAAQREEELLQRRLDLLHRSRLYQPDTYAPIYQGASVYRPYNDRLELLRRQVAEEERLAQLESLHRRQRILEEIEGSRLLAARRRRELEEMQLLSLERAIRERESQLARAERRLAKPSPVFVTRNTDLCHSILPLQRPEEELVRNLVVRVPDSRPARLPTKQAEILRRPLPQESRKEQLARTASGAGNSDPQAVHLNRLFQQLGLLAPANKVHTESKREGQRIVPPEVPKMRTEDPSKTSTPQLAKTPVNPSTASAPVVDLSQFLHSLIYAGKVEENKVPTQSKTVQATLKDQLEERLNNEYSNEIRDTVQAVLASLEDNNRTTVTAPQTSTANTSFAPNSSLKGKSKESPVLEAELKVPSSGDIAAGLSRILSLEKHFHTLEDEFVFPNNLEFVTSPSTGLMSAISRLTYIATNQPIRFYEQSLSHLLAELDSIESYGNEELRKKRKEVVSRVERALEELEQVVEKRWKATPGEVPSERLTIPTPTSAPADGSETGIESPDPALVSSQLAEKIVEVEEVPAQETLTKQPVEAEPAAASFTRIQGEYTSEVEGLTSGEDASVPAETDVEEQSLTGTSVLAEPPVSEVLPSEGSRPEELWFEHANDEVPEEDLASPTGPVPVQIPQPIPDNVPETQIVSSTSQTDLSTTIRPSAPIPKHLDSEPELESESESMGEGFLLENETERRDTPSKYKDTDEDSMVSDWSEVDGMSQ